jgi:steroid delta-isomerase-like uncharacterized protein
MSQANKKITGRFLKEVVNEGRMETIDELVAEDYVYHGPNGETMQGREALKSMFAELRRGFPDLTIHPHFLIAEDNRIGIQYTLTGTHLGAFQTIPPTRKKMKVEGMVMSRIEAGVIREDWEMYDTMLMMSQLGLDG